MYLRFGLNHIRICLNTRQTFGIQSWIYHFVRIGQVMFNFTSLCFISFKKITTSLLMTKNFIWYTNLSVIFHDDIQFRNFFNGNYNQALQFTFTQSFLIRVMWLCGSVLTAWKVISKIIFAADVLWRHGVSLCGSIMIRCHRKQCKLFS